MKKFLTAMLVILCLSMLMGCQNQNSQSTSRTNQEAPLLVSNLADEESQKEVESALKKALAEKDAMQFLEAVKDYNKTIKETTLIKGFAEQAPEYDIATMISLWEEAKGLYIGSNCRITTFTLLKDSLQIPEGNIDDTSLFMDKDAILNGNLFNEEETQRFGRLFSRVKTERTQDISVHVKKMQEHFSGFSFNDKAKMISVVLHDTLDGDYLFIGHVGVMIKDRDHFLFFEKLSFDEPYQVLKFQKEEDCYKLLLKRYQNYFTEDSAKPFIMINGEFAGHFE